MPKARSKPQPKRQIVTAPSVLAPMAFDTMPNGSFVREAHLVPSQRHPGPKILPFSSATLWRLVSRGDFPKPIKLSSRVTCWRVGDIRQWLAQQGQ